MKNCSVYTYFLQKHSITELSVITILAKNHDPLFSLKHFLHARKTLPSFFYEQNPNIGPAERLSTVYSNRDQSACVGVTETNKTNSSVDATVEHSLYATHWMF